MASAGGDMGGERFGGDSGGSLGSIFPWTSSKGERLSEYGLEPVLSWLSCEGDRGSVLY